jgi:hypothetical protein
MRHRTSLCGLGGRQVKGSIQRFAACPRRGVVPAYRARLRAPHCRNRRSPRLIAGSAQAPCGSTRFQHAIDRRPADLEGLRYFRSPEPPRLHPGVSLWYTFSAMRFRGCRSGGWVGELQWTALPYTSSLLKSAAPRPRSPKPSKGSHHLRLNSPSRTGEPNPLSRFGRLLQNAAAQDGCRPAEQAGLADGADPDRPHRWLRRPLRSCHPTKKGPSSGTTPRTRTSPRLSQFRRPTIVISVAGRLVTPSSLAAW